MPNKRKSSRFAASQDAEWDYEPMPDYTMDDAQAVQTKATGRLQRDLDERREDGAALVPVLPESARDLSTTTWGKAWNKHLQAFADHSSALAKGRTEFRKGRVLDLLVTDGQIVALVASSRLWDVQINVEKLDSESWADLRHGCMGQISDLSGLLAGEVPDTVMNALANPETGLFPTASHLRARCTCPDHASLCIHAAAVLYAFGTQLDTNPTLLFKARGGTPQDIIAKLDEVVTSLTSTEQETARSEALAGQDLSELFGTDIEE